MERHNSVPKDLKASTEHKQRKTEKKKVPTATNSIVYTSDVGQHHRLLVRTPTAVL